jgi:metal-dependent amidase/aminoacylase/carboxypeptidase family protein
MTGSVRTFRSEVQDHIRAAMDRIVSGICESARCKSEFKYIPFIPVTVNDPQATELAKSVAEAVLGADKVKESELIMGSEDFSYYSHAAPSVFVNLGVGSAEKKSTFSHHSPKFDVDESVLYLGAALYASFAWRCLEQK